MHEYIELTKTEPLIIAIFNTRYIKRYYKEEMDVHELSRAAHIRSRPWLEKRGEKKKIKVKT